MNPSKILQRAFRLNAAVLIVCLAMLAGHTAQTNAAGTNEFSFVVAGDMRNYVEPLPDGKRQFDGACEAMKRVGAGEFMVVPGDFDPPAPVRGMIDRYLDTNYFCYFVVGNHEVASAPSMDWVRRWGGMEIPHLVRRGPAGATTSCYTFDFGSAHFVALSDYFDGKSDTASKADISDAEMAWLEQDLAATHQPLIWIICHVPLVTLPDMDTGRHRHPTDSLIPDPTRRARFVELLKKYRVRGLICGHTHGASVEKVEGIWQADSGHARGAGDPGAPSTFLKFHITGDKASVDIYRADSNGDNYKLRKTVELN